MITLNSLNFIAALTALSDFGVPTLIVLVIALAATFVLFRPRSSMDRPTLRLLQLLALGVGSIILLSLVSSGLRWVGFGLVMALVGYAIQWIGVLRGELATRS